MSRMMLVTCPTPWQAERVCDGLSVAYPDYVFTTAPNSDGVGASVYVQTSAAGLRLVLPAVVASMERYAAGFLAALKAHCLQS